MDTGLVYEVIGTDATPAVPVESQPTLPEQRRMSRRGVLGGMAGAFAVGVGAGAVATPKIRFLAKHYTNADKAPGSTPITTTTEKKPVIDPNAHAYLFSPERTKLYHDFLQKQGAVIIGLVPKFSNDANYKVTKQPMGPLNADGSMSNGKVFIKQEESIPGSNNVSRRNLLEVEGVFSGGTLVRTISIGYSSGHKYSWSDGSIQEATKPGGSQTYIETSRSGWSVGDRPLVTGGNLYTLKYGANEQKIREEDQIVVERILDEIAEFQAAVAKK